MALKNYAYYNVSTGLIENIIYIDEQIAPTLVWSEGYTIVDIPAEGLSGEWSTLSSGWLYIDGQFVEPPQPEVPDTAQPISQGAQDL